MLQGRGFIRSSYNHFASRSSKRLRCCAHHYFENAPSFSSSSFTYLQNSRCFTSFAPIVQDTTTDASTSKQSTNNLFPLLNEHERTLLQEQKDITDRARALAHRVGIPILNDHNLLQQLATFSVVVAGEYNAGKSSLINALLGEPRLLETGTLPTTDTIAILSASPPPDNWDHSVHFHHLPHNAFLQDLTLVDTPGTNAILTHHTAQTLRLLPSADWILFVTSADRPLSESERQLLEVMARDYRKSIVLVINKMDILDRAGGWHGAEEKQKVVDFVQTNVASLLGARPMVIPVSAHIPSQVAVLSQFLKETLSHHTKIQSKLTSPLGVAETWVHQCLTRVTTERQALRDHAVTLQLVQSHVEGWKKESKSEMELIRMRMARYLRTQQGDRAHLFLKHLTVWQFYSLAFQLDPVAWDRTGPLASSKSSVKSNDPARDDLQQMTYEAASSLATKTRAQGQAVIELLGHRASSNAPFSLVGHITAASRFEETHERIRERLELVLQRTIHEEENTNFYGDSFQRTLSRLALASIGWNALSLAAGLLYCEWQGFGMASASVAAGTAVLFSGRSHAAQHYAQIWHTKADQLEQDLQAVWEEELERLERQTVQGISPFQRFVQAEEERLNELQTEADSILHASQKLRYQVSQEAPKE
ncbi:hypothetical protein FisN_32Hh013 [Fistulifera solaris]|uniref:G domain-containing protein n=1 Tax=Fistulifera solaris TaxID=1519565 RepID=A0A1Z5K3H3_FISSO|nr:hypothetical protein FisN_32Hh013 [Fistulifera solaris]|eukprot:GAX20631.1 hypothetical protein FisN_32Hh013 [Fistulifera solaris]